MRRVIGNDVVDLRDADARPGGLHPRFDEKAFSDAERAWLADGPDPSRRRWTLWAAKEAAFKALRQRDPGVGFAPRRFRVWLDAPGRTGVVRLGAVELGVRVDHGPDWVHALASDTARATWSLEAVADEREARRAVRHLARAGLPDGVRVERRERIPELHWGGRRAPLSLSHHGRFVACARLGFGDRS